MKTYTIFWLTGESQLVTGVDASSAMNNAGIGRGALRAIDFYAEGDRRSDYSWDESKRTWNKIKVTA